MAARGLVPDAAAHLTRDALGAVDFSRLAPLKGLIKQFFSDRSWTTNDDRTLADLMGPGDGWWSYGLGDAFDLAFGWRDGDFRIELSRVAAGAETRTTTAAAAEPIEHLEHTELLGDTFASTVVPEATPNPRTIRFVTGPIHTGPSRWYESAANVDDPRAAALFAEFDAVDNVLVGPDFVAVGLHRAPDWEVLLAPVLRVVASQFTGATDDTPPVASPRPTGDGRAPEPATPPRGGGTELDRAWRVIGQLHANLPDDLDRILEARSSANPADRQVAARLVVDADPATAQDAWDGLLADASRTVRRATVDAMVDTERAALRPLLERALDDTDPWIRWKALRGLVDLGVEPSRAAIAALATDADFRVRLEATSALRAPTSSD